MKNAYSVIGLMSGTSLDGLDIAWCFFLKKKDRWLFEIKKTQTVDYPSELKKDLKDAHLISGKGLVKLNVEFGRFCGHAVNRFIVNHEIEYFDFVASHGHTVFHQPEKGYTLQIGCPYTIATLVRAKVIADFRSLDVALGGQGAPLVPVGDHLLFSEYAACLNLGGFANVSMEVEGARVAWDICPVNFVLNHYAASLGLEYDKNGNMAKSGKVIGPLFDALEKLDFYQTPFPKSLGREWVEQEVLPLIDSMKLEVKDILCTFVEHVAHRINDDLKAVSGRVLVSGGGTFNTYLLERITSLNKCDFTSFDSQIVDFKEALIFAFLGVLKDRGEVNVLASVTGARKDSSAGIVFEV